MKYLKTASLRSRLSPCVPLRSDFLDRPTLTQTITVYVRFLTKGE